MMLRRRINKNCFPWVLLLVLSSTAMGTPSSHIVFMPVNGKLKSKFVLTDSVSAEKPSIETPNLLKTKGNAALQKIIIEEDMQSSEKPSQEKPTESSEQ